MRNQMTDTELHAAFCWDCDNCGKENFVRAIEGDIDEAAMEAQLDQIVPELIATEAEELDDGSMMSPFFVQRICLMPATVCCTFCGSTFTSTVYMQEDEE